MGNSNSLLKLTKSQVNDVITQIEENSPRLTLVEISYCPSLGKRHLEKLTEGLKRNTHVQQLCLYGNNLGDKGAIMLADALMENGHIQDVALGSNNIGDTGLSALTEILGTNSSIRTLDLVYNKIGNEGASLLAGVLSKHDALQAVNLGHNKIGNHGASALAFALRENKSLQAIYMNANKIDDQGVQAFIETLHDCNTTLINVSLKENLSVNLDKLARLEGLCERNRGGDSSDAETDKKKKFQDILEKVRQDDPDLSFVDLSYNSSTMGEFSALTKALKQNTHVQQLILYGDNIGDEGAAMLAESLKENQHLGMVILGFANIGDEGASSLAEVLRMNTSVQTLDLVYNKIGDDGASSLAQVLTANKTLQGINLGHNKIGNTGAFALAHALRENQSIRALHLRSNEIDDDEAVQAFADSLSDYNTTLTTISLENNRVNIGERLSRIAELCERNRNQPSSETKGIPESRLAAGSTKANMNVSSCATSKDASSKSSAPKTIRQNTSALAKARAFVESEARAEKANTIEQLRYEVKELKKSVESLEMERTRIMKPQETTDQARNTNIEFSTAVQSIIKIIDMHHGKGNHNYVSSSSDSAEINTVPIDKGLRGNVKENPVYVTGARVLAFFKLYIDLEDIPASTILTEFKDYLSTGDTSVHGNYVL